MAEQQAAHRRTIESKVVHGNIERERWGQIIGAILYAGTVALGGILLWQGYDTGGLGAIIAPTVGAVAIFISGRRKRETELAHKRAGQE